MFEFNQPLPERNVTFSTKKAKVPVFSFNSVDEEKTAFAENSQQIRKQFATQKPVTARVFAEFAEFAPTQELKKTGDNQNKDNSQLKQPIDANISGHKFKDDLYREANYDPFDDRHFCHECRNLVNRYCIVQRFRPVDTHVRRCSDFGSITKK